MSPLILRQITIKATLFCSYLKVFYYVQEVKAHMFFGIKLCHIHLREGYIPFLCAALYINLYHIATLVIYFKINILWCVIVT